jgi:drug/metabolite transporter (DMT)-like permease
MGSLGWAVVLSVFSAASYAAAAVAQERLAEHGQRGLHRWAIALVLTGGGVGLHVVALNFGTVAVVQALGTLTLLFALPIAAIRYRSRVGLAAWADAALTVAGLALIMSLSVESGGPSTLSTTASRYISLVALILVVVLTVGAWLVGPTMRAIQLAAAAGVAFGISSVLSKAVLAAFTDGGPKTVSLFATAMVVLLSIAGYLLSQLSYRGAGLAAPLATVSVSNPVVAAIAGVIVFDEGFRFGVTGLIVVAVAAVAIAIGVVGLSRHTAVTGTGTAPEYPEPFEQPTQRADSAAPGTEQSAAPAAEPAPTPDVERAAQP